MHAKVQLEPVRGKRHPALAWPARTTVAVWFARNRWAAVVAVGVFSLLFVVQGALRRRPQPSNMDEFSALVAADTFAHGRITNPTPALWEHFETLHVIMVPTYTSKYPPGPSLILALGERIFGDPLWGVWFSTAIACAALTWMLLAWLPVRWALLGGFLAALHPLIVTWGRFYLCCNLGVLGGCLLLGGAKRLIRRPRYLHGLLLATGVAILANVRPYEGAMLTVGVAIWLLLAMPRYKRSFRILLLTVLPVLLVTFCAMAYYNWRVTGSALKMPYMAHAEQYDAAPSFWFLKARHLPDYRHPNLLMFHLWELSVYQDFHDGWQGLKMLAMRPLQMILWLFDVSMITLLAMFWIWRQRLLRPLLWLCVVMMVTMLLPTWLNSNYVSPGLPVYFVVITVSLRRASRVVVPGTKLLIGPLLVGMIAVATFVWAIQDVHPIRVNDSNYGYTRARMIGNLHRMGGKHVIFVHCYAAHEEQWIYNDADIEHSQVIWAHDMGPQANQELLATYTGRQVWFLDADVQPTRLRAD